MSSADLVVLRFVPETTIGVTPATPAWTQVRYTGESLNFNIENTKTAEIRPDRTEVDLIQTSASGGGDINIEFSYNTFREWLAAALCNDWTGTTVESLKNGVLRKSYTVQKHFQDMDVPQFHNYRGTCVEGFNLSMDIGKIVEGSFNMMSFGIDPITGVATSQITGSTFNPQITTSPMNAVTNLQDFTIDGVPYTGCISSLQLQVKNNLRAIQCLGSLNPRNMKLGTIEVTGDLEFYFNEGSNYAKFVAGTEFDFTFALEDDAGNRYNFVFPRCKFETGEVVAGGRNTDVMFTAKWRGLYDATSDQVMQIYTGGGTAPPPPPPPPGPGLRPRFAVGPANSADIGNIATFFLTMTPYGTAGSVAGSFERVTSSSYGWVFAPAALTTAGLIFAEGAFFGGWSGAGLPGDNTGATTNPSESTVTYTDPSGNVWRVFREDYATTSTATFVTSAA